MMKYAGLAARFLAGSILIFSGVYKAAGAPEEFAIIISFYNIVPSPLVMGLAAVLPWIELIIGFSLLFGYFSKPAAGAALGLFSAFFLALLSTMIRGIELPNCGCFGGGWHLPVWATTIMDAGLIALSALSFRHGAELASLDNWAEARTH
jgi:uncharacterized membrane protein YphA (DoxX/SURF4 family)